MQARTLRRREVLVRWMAGVGIAILVACGGRGSPGDGGAGSGAVGSPCVRNADCDQGFCLPITDTRSVCSETCQTSDDCVAGWTCGPVAGVSDDLCSCEPADEDCDGADDDCDGVVDNGMGAAVGCPVGNDCVDAACRCSAANTCGGSCVDLLSDSANCGECGRTCTSPMACSGGACAAPVGITARAGDTCVWFADGPSYCWGDNMHQQIVLDATTPVPPTRLEVGAVRMVSAGERHTCVVTVNGNVVCQGASDFLGGGPLDPSVHRATPIASGDALGVAVGAAHSCAWLRDGRVFCWGNNFSGQLGAGPVGMARYTPTLVEGLDAVVKVAAGYSATCAIVQSGELYCWGDIPGATTNSVTPVRVDLPTADEIVVAQQFLAITTDDRFWCWGENEFAQAAADPAGGNYEIAAPTAIGVVSPAIAAAAGFFHSCAITADGDGYCWGANPGGQLGTGSTTNSYMPVLVAGGHSFRAVAAGTGETCGLTEDGVFCWGVDAITGTPRLTPTPVTLF